MRKSAIATAVATLALGAVGCGGANPSSPSASAVPETPAGVHASLASFEARAERGDVSACDQVVPAGRAKCAQGIATAQALVSKTQWDAVLYQSAHTTITVTGNRASWTASDGSTQTAIYTNGRWLFTSY